MCLWKPFLLSLNTCASVSKNTFQPFFKSEAVRILESKNLYLEDVVLAGVSERADWIVIGFAVSFSMVAPFVKWKNVFRIGYVFNSNRCTQMEPTFPMD